MEVVASLSQGRRAATQCGLFTHKSVPVICEPPCIKLSGSQPVSRHIKLKIHETIIRTFLTYWSEAWASAAKEVNILRILERKTVRKMCGPLTEG